MSNAASNHALESLRTQMRGLMNKFQDDMASGGCRDFPDYTHKTGIIEGLALAERELLDLDQRMTES